MSENKWYGSLTALSLFVRDLLRNGVDPGEVSETVEDVLVNWELEAIENDDLEEPHEQRMDPDTGGESDLHPGD